MSLLSLPIGLVHQQVTKYIEHTFGDRSCRIRSEKDRCSYNPLCPSHAAKSSSERSICKGKFYHPARNHARVRENRRDCIDGDIASADYSGKILNHTEAHDHATEENI
ncbi:MAG: hypothetical protein CMM54_09285 [Rhodospirillaceae bacterium]|nr:hypothetical protein [Rhodospirillaceae bacterium]